MKLFVRFAVGAVACALLGVDQIGIDQFKPFTRPAVMYGGGLFYAFPQSRVEVFGELKGLTYQWNTPGLRRTMFD